MSVRLGAALAVVFALAACSVTQSINDLTKVEYKTASRGTPLEIPPDMVSPRRDERFVVPERAAESTTTYSAYSRDRSAQPKPGAVAPGVLPEVTGARIERQGDQRWLVVDMPPDRVWPIVRGFWVESGFALRVDSPETGVLETEWAETRPPVPEGWVRGGLSRVLGTLYTTGERDKFRTRLESAGKGTEVFVSHRGMTEELSGALKESTVWVQRPGNPDLEAEFLRRLMLRLTPVRAGDAVAASGKPQEQLAALGGAPAPATPSKAAIVEVDGRPQVKLQQDFDRAWRQVGLVLDRSGFTVEDRDRSQGTFFVRYVDPQQEAEAAGVFGRLFGTAGKRDLSGARYRIVVAADQPGTRVGVLDEQGKPPATDADRRVAAQIVSLLQDQLK
jgi:outer membrane protein assembly factor BamC